MGVVSIEYIEVDERGVARVAGSRSKVSQIVLDRMVHGWDAEQIHAQYPHLSLAQIHAAFSYYYDHQATIDAEIAADVQTADALRAKLGESSIAARLRNAAEMP